MFRCFLCHTKRYHVICFCNICINSCVYIYIYIFMFFSLSLSPFLCWNTYSPRGICLFSVWKVMLISLSNLQVQFLGASALHDCIQRLMVLVKGWWSRDVVAKNGCLTSGCTSFGKDVHLLSKSREKTWKLTLLGLFCLVSGRRGIPRLFSWYFIHLWAIYGKLFLVL